ncbi:MAG: hypothetical protein AAGJ51_05275 [Pseudomonadota bacterium]
MFSRGKDGQPEWNGGTHELAYGQAWLSAIELALESSTPSLTQAGSRLARELEFAKRTLERDLNQ